MEDKSHFNILNFKCLSVTLAYMELFKMKIETQFTLKKKETTINEKMCEPSENTQIGEYNQHQMHGELSDKPCVHRLLHNDPERTFIVFFFFYILKNNLKESYYEFI